MSLESFIPELWSSRLNQNLHRAEVFAKVVNRDYEGEIKAMGDTIRIMNIGPVTVASYTKNTDINDPQALSDAQQALVIDTADYYNFQVDDVDKAQGNPMVMNEAMRESAYALADKADQYIAAMYKSAGIVVNTNDAGAAVPTTSTAYEMLIDLQVALHKNNVPRSDRWVVIPPWYWGFLVKDDRVLKYGLGFQNTTGYTQGALPGAGENDGDPVGQAAGFTIYMSNNVSTNGTSYRVMAGSRMSITFADQILKTEAYRPQKRFADAVKGLHVYGGKAVRPEALACMFVKAS